MAPAPPGGLGEPNHQGFWGEASSTIDWCEANYAVSYYVAEFWNTVSNVFIFAPPIFGIADALYQGFEKRLIAAYASLFVIGLGSVMFHATLRYEMQLMDEVPMIYGTAVIGYCVYQLREPPGRSNWLLVLFLAAYCLLFTVVYLVFKDPYIHEGMFLVMVFTILLVGARRNLGSSTSPSTVALGAAGLVMYALGGLTWNVDNHFCRRLGQARSPYGPLPPAARPLTQLHAWWHLFSGLGTYLLLLAGLTMRLRILKRDFEVVWCWFGLRVVLLPDNNNTNNLSLLSGYRSASGSPNKSGKDI